MLLVLCISSEEEVAIWFWYSAHRLKMLYLSTNFVQYLEKFLSGGTIGDGQTDKYRQDNCDKN